MPNDQFVCCACGRQFRRVDFQDDVWSRFCSLTCCFGYFRAHMPKARPVPPFSGEKRESEIVSSESGGENAGTKQH